MTNTSYYKIREQDELLIIDLIGDSLSGVNIQEEFGDPLAALIAEKKNHKVLVNFSAVKLVSSDAIGSLIRLRKEIKDLGGDIKLYGLDSNVRLSFKLLNLDGTMFEIFETEAQAAKALV